jgi:hypothetical protein
MTADVDERFPILRLRATGLVAAAYALLALVMTQLRLLDTLGYESALVFSLLAAIVGAALPLRAFRSINGMNVSDIRSTPLLWLRVAVTGVLLLVLPMAVLTANAAFVRNCALFDGALFWLLLPVPSVLFTSAIVLLLRVLFDRRALWVYILLLLLFLFQPFVQIFTQPQLFAYNHIFGMFLGLSWDQTQPPFLTILLYRCLTAGYLLLLLCAATALRLGRRRGGITGRQRLVLLAVFVPALALVGYGTVSSDALGFSSGYPWLRAELGSEYRDGPVLLVYDSTAFSDEEIRHVAREHRFQLTRVCEALDVVWSGTLTSYLYTDRDMKKRLLGTESSQIARPWRKEIHLSREFWRESVKHEIVHVVAGAFGPYLTGAPFVRVLGLTEGLAMAVEWSWGNRTLHQHAAAMLAQDLLPTAEQCIGTMGFVGNSSSVSYVASGSLTRWLMDSLGVKILRKAYAADNLEAATGLDYAELDSRWRVFLSTVQRELPDSLATAYAFRRTSLFTAECPRVVTERSREAADALAAGEAEIALQRYRAIEVMAPNSRAVFGMVNAMYQLASYDSVLQASTRYLADSTRAYTLYPLLLWHGAASWSKGDSTSADRAFSSLLRERLPGWPTELAARMRRALRCPDEDRTPLREALLGGLRREENEDSLRLARAALLAARLDVMDRMAPSAAILLEEWTRLVVRDHAGRAVALHRLERFPLDGMHLELRMLAGSVFYLQGEYSRAERLFGSALEEDVDAMTRIEIEEWLARCAWSAEQQHVQ